MPPIVVGLVLLAMGVWLAWEMEQQITYWPLTNAVLVRQDPSSAGTRLVFRYEVGGRRFAGVAFHWGEQTASKVPPERYSLVAVTLIAYNPKNPAEITDALNYRWEGVRVPIFCFAAGVC